VRGLSRRNTFDWTNNTNNEEGKGLGFAKSQFIKREKDWDLGFAESQFILSKLG
jgi:hypothetical protein